MCIVHMIRNSASYMSCKDQKAVCRDLKRIYSAPSEEEALLGLDDFAMAWYSKYPKKLSSFPYLYRP